MALILFLLIWLAYNGFFLRVVLGLASPVRRVGLIALALAGSFAVMFGAAYMVLLAVAYFGPLIGEYAFVAVGLVLLLVVLVALVPLHLGLRWLANH